MRDVSRILSDAELLKLRALLQQTPEMQSLAGKPFGEYPKMLFHPDWLTCFRLIKDHPDPLIKKEAQEKIRLVQVIVHDIETEEEYLLDGWVRDPNELIVRLGERDPRVPTGQEGRRATVAAKMDREARLANLRREYAELTGRRLLDEPELLEPVAAAPSPAEDDMIGEAPRGLRAKTPPPVSDKRARVAAAARRAVSGGTSATA